MKVEMLMPQMGESIAEATISKWLKQPGETVERDEIILEISTDKVDSEIPAPASGIISELFYSEGDVVPVKTVIAAIDTEASTSPSANGASSKEVQLETPKIEVKEASPQPVESSSERFYSPLVKSLAKKHNVNLSELDSLEGSGLGGRFTKDDFLNFLDNRGKTSQTTTSTTQLEVSAEVPTATQPKKPTPIQANPQGELNEIEKTFGSNVDIVPMDGMRRAIAEHMVRSKQTSPHVYSIQEVDMTLVSKWRKQYKALCKEKEGFNLSFTPFFLEAAIKGLLEYPHINASVVGNSIVVKKMLI